MSINWELIESNWQVKKWRVWKPPTFTDDQIKAAQTAAKALPSSDGDPNHVAMMWKPAKNLPDISQIDMSDAVQQVASLASLRSASSHDWLNRSKIVAHIAHPGEPVNLNPFTVEPLLVSDGDKLMIADGHHRIAALMLLGAQSWQFWTVPKS